MTSVLTRDSNSSWMISLDSRPLSVDYNRVKIPLCKNFEAKEGMGVYSRWAYFPLGYCSCLRMRQIFIVFVVSKNI